MLAKSAKLLLNQTLARLLTVVVLRDQQDGSKLIVGCQAGETLCSALGFYYLTMTKRRTF